MSKRTSGIEEIDLSDLIGEIYDCVIDPTLWEATLEKLRRVLNCAGCALFVTDLQQATSRMQNIVGVEQEWAVRYPDYAADAAAMMSSVPDLMRCALDDPVVGRRDIDEQVFLSSRYWQEWGAPQGIVDFIALRLMQGPGRVAGIAFGRNQEHGLITDREVRLLRLIAPHLRRAVVISDLIDMKSIEATALGHTLDMVPAGVVLVAEDAAILHANSAAGRMIDDASPILSAAGRLSVPDTATALQLHRIVAAAARNEAEIGDAGIGMALMGHAGPPATAHVLPIAEGQLRSHLLPKSAAAVFIASEGSPRSMDLAPVANLYGLSGAETRLLERLARGDSLAEAASALSISQNTAKTHLSHILTKTGTQRQAKLVALINKLVSPVAAPDGR